MDLKQLRYFTTVAEEGTISAAAKKLFMSQPPLSTQMKLLEQELGCSLFERGQKHIRLTETGRLLYDRAQTLLRMEASMRQDVEACARTEKDPYRGSFVGDMYPCGRVDIGFSEEERRRYHRDNGEQHIFADREAADRSDTRGACKNTVP